MIRVLHVVGIMNRAGLETFIMNMYRCIDKEKYSFDFLCLMDQKGDYDNEIYELGGEIFYAPLKANGGVRRHFYNYALLKREFKKYVGKYDIVHIHNYHAFDSYLYAKSALSAGFKKTIVHSHSTNAEFHKWLHYCFRYLLDRLPIVKLACSQKAGEWLFGDKNIKVISNGIDTKRYEFNLEIRKKYRNEFGLDNCFVIGHVGRFEYVKNQVFLCEILPAIQNSIPNAKLVFVGDGVELDNVKKICYEKHIEGALFLGSRNDVNNFYQIFDIFAFPSFFEGIPLSIIEAETSGLPCVVSSGVPFDVDIVDNIYHINLNNPDEWVRKICAIYRMSIDRTINKTQIVNKGYDIYKSCEELEKIYGSFVVGGDIR